MKEKGKKGLESQPYWSKDLSIVLPLNGPQAENQAYDPLHGYLTKQCSMKPKSNLLRGSELWPAISPDLGRKHTSVWCTKEY